MLKSQSVNRPTKRVPDWTAFEEPRPINTDVQLGQEVSGECAGGAIATVNARELHGFLRSADMFAHWIKKRIDKYGFTEGIDYTTSDYLGKNPNIPQGRGRPAKDYHISIDMAKELAMVERNEQGKQARLYSIRINAFVP